MGDGPGRRLRRSLPAVLGVLGVVFLWRVRAILTPFAFALLLTYLLYPTVDRLASRLGRPLAILLVYVWLGVLVWLLAGLLLPPLFRQLAQASLGLPGYLAQMERIVRHWEAGYRRFGLPRPAAHLTEGMLARAEAGLHRFGGEIFGGIFGLLPTALAALVSPALAYYFLRDLTHLRRLFWSRMPATRRAETASILAELDAVLGGFIRGQLLVAAGVGAISMAVLYLLRVPFPLLLGFLAGLTDIIPYVGPFLGGIPAVLAGFLRSPATAAWVAVAFFAIHQVEGTILAPKVVGRRVGLHPLLVIFALLAGGELWGVAGMLLSVPIAGFLKVLLRHLLAPALADREGP